MEKNAARLKVVREWLRIVAGLTVFAFGVHLTVFANIGLAPWDCLGMGIAKHTPLNYGLAMTLIAVIVLFIDIGMGERIGYGTVIDALLTGNLTQMFNDLNPFPMNRSLPLGVALMVIGFAFMAIGIMIYMSAGQGCGPRDSLLLGLGRRLKRVPIGVVEMLLWIAVTVAGAMLGGPVGIGTLVGTFGAGAVMQAVYSLLHFEPRDVRQRSLGEITHILIQK